MLQMLIGPAVELAKDFVKGKAEEKKAIQKRKIQAIEKDANWEEKMASATDKSWKDEFWSVILSLPILAVAYSVATDNDAVIERLNSAFDTLNTLPEWYKYVLFIAVSGSFGLKSADKIMNLKNKGKK